MTLLKGTDTIKYGITHDHHQLSSWQLWMYMNDQTEEESDFLTDPLAAAFICPTANYSDGLAS